jgi:hypothetical protein
MSNVDTSRFRGTRSRWSVRDVGGGVWFTGAATLAWGSQAVVVVQGGGLSDGRQSKDKSRRVRIVKTRPVTRPYDRMGE